MPVPKSYPLGEMLLLKCKWLDAQLAEHFRKGLYKSRSQVIQSMTSELDERLSNL